MGSKTLERKIKVLEQAVMCQRMRKQGLSIRAIADLVGVSHMTVWRRLRIKTPENQGRWCNFQYTEWRERRFHGKA